MMTTTAFSILDKEYTLSPHSRFLKKHGMYSAALFYKNLNETIERRAARVVRFHLETCDVPDYQPNQSLFAPYQNRVSDGRNNDDLNNYGCIVNLEGGCCVDEQKFLKLLEIATNEHEKYIINSIVDNAKNMYATPCHVRYLHNGIHNVVDFEFILHNGFNGYRKKIESLLESTLDEESRQFQFAMLDVVEGITSYITRYQQKLEKLLNDSQQQNQPLSQLVTALKTVPLNPASNFYEAFITLSAAMYFSNFFETGRIDQLLYPYYEADLKAQTISKDKAFILIREMFVDIEKRIGHPGATHVTIGGTNQDGTASYNELTEIAILAIRGLRTPNMTLRVREDMPQSIWDTYLENLNRGSTQPAIVNESLFIDGLTTQYNVPYKDAVNYVFGGCSEVLIQGKTMCDSTWVSYNMLDIFEHTLYNNFLNCDTFEEFYEVFKKDIKVTLKDMSHQINLRQHMFSLHMPHPITSLMTGGCIENSKSFLNGGATYNFDSTNVYGSTNTINALYSLKMFYKKHFNNISKEEFLKCFINNYKGYESIYHLCKNTPKFGNYNEEINALTNDLMTMTFNEIRTFNCYRQNGFFMPAVILWVTWVTAGNKVGATPDGRSCSEPLADSAGPMQGTDTEGPTSTMGATLAIPQKYCVGTCILNLLLDPKNFKDENSRTKVQHLLKTYFQEGGSHLQINVLDKNILLDALENPDKHRDIIVRVGGFSDNFVLLNPKVQQQIIKRIQHQL